MVINMKKILLGIIIIIIFAASYFTFFKKEKLEEGVVDEVNGYVLKANESSYQNSLFAEFKTLLKSEYTDEEYVTIVSKLFLTDNLSLKTAMSKNDVGGVQFVYESFREDFTRIARDTIYKFVENNIYGDRKQELPLVEKVEVLEVTSDTFELDESDVDVLKVTAKVTYEKDLGYQKEVELLFVEKNNKFEVIKMD